VTLHDLIQLAKAHGRGRGGSWGEWLKGVSRFVREHGDAFRMDDHNWTDGLMLLVYRDARIPTAQELAADMRHEWDDPVTTWEATCFLDALTASAGWGGPPQASEEDGPRAGHIQVRFGADTQPLIDAMRARIARLDREEGCHAG